MSDGLTTKAGRKIVFRKVNNENLNQQKILLITLPKYGIGKALIKSCKTIGFCDEKIVIYEAGMILKDNFDFIYVTEGNTFEILDFIQKNRLDLFIRNSCITLHTNYIGASAGAMIAGKDVEFANDFDENTIGLSDLKSLNLFDGTIIPHFTSAQRNEYLRSTDQKLIDRYRRIYSVANGKVLVLKT